MRRGWFIQENVTANAPKGWCGCGMSNFFHLNQKPETTLFFFSILRNLKKSVNGRTRLKSDKTFFLDTFSYLLILVTTRAHDI
jgi:hypothetical protein